MKTFIKIALIVAGAVVVLITAAALLVPRLVDPNKYKDRIEALAKENTGRDLAITGDIDLSVFPWLGAEIGGVTLGNAPGFEGDTFSSFRKVKVKIKLMPLLSKRIEADVIVIEGLVVNLEKDADGHTNWEDLAQASAAPTATEAPEPETAPAEESQTPESALAALSLGGLEILDARINWTDRQAGTGLTVEHLTLTTSAVNLEDPVDIQLGFDLGTGAMGLAGSFQAGVSVAFDPAAGRYAANGISLTADLRGDTVPGGTLALSLGANAAFDANAQSFDLGDLRLEVQGLTLSPYSARALIEAGASGDLATGIIRLTGFKASATLTGEGETLAAELSAAADADLNNRQFSISDLAISIPTLAMKGLAGAIETKHAGSATADLTAGTLALDFPALSGTLAGDAVPGDPVPVALDLSIRGDLNKKTYDITPVTLTLGDLAATVNLNMVQQEEGPQIAGTLAVAAFNLRDLAGRLGIALPEMADPKALSSAEMKLSFAADTDNAAVESLLVRVDDTRLTGTLGAKNFTAPEITVDVGVDRVPLENYLPPGGTAETGKLLSNLALKGKITADEKFQVFQVARLALSGKLDKKLDFGLTLADTRADLAEEKISVESLALKAGGMTLKAKANVTAFSTTPAFTAEIDSETFNLRQILSDFELMPETADAKAMKSVSLKAGLSGSPDAVSASSIKIRLDDTTITGKADAVLSPAPAYAFDMAVDTIDADRYLPPEATETAGKGKSAKTATSSGSSAATAGPTPLPVEMLRSLALDGKLAVGKLKIKKLNLSDIQLTVVAKEGLLTLDPMALDLYDGSSSGKITLDARSSVPTLAVTETLAGVASGNLMKALTGEAKVSGAANADVNLTAAGADTDALIAALGGTVAFTFTDGSIKGIDIVGKLCNTLMAVDAGSLKTEDLVGSALQMLTQKATGTKATSTQTESDSTSFSEMGGSMTFAKGVGTSEDLSLKSPLLRVQGAGSLDLGQQTLDYDATAYLVKSCQGQGGKGTDDLKNVPIPVTISGPLSNLKVKPNLTAGILEVLAREQKKSSGSSTTSSQQKTATTEKKQEAPETVEDAVTGILQNLLK